ncbi:MAG: hypothetical protein ACFFAS_05235 [Promethearchaeota archaeon]
MTEITDIKKEFLSTFQSKVLQGRRLLSNANHTWADKLFNDLFYEIERTEWLDAQKKQQLVMIIVNTWHLYINSLVKRDDSGMEFDHIRYLDAYNRFFTFLSKLDDFYHFRIFFTNLLKSFLEMEDISQAGISKFINSFCRKLHEREEFLDLIELQILLMYLRKSVLPTNLFLFSMEYLNEIVAKLIPDMRGLFLAVFLENISIKYNLTNASNFTSDVNKILLNRLPNDLKTEFGKLGRISINQRTFPTVLNEITELIYYLNNIGEESWIITIIRYIYSKLEEFQSFPDAINYIRQFIDFSIDRNKFNVTYSIYDFMEDLFIIKSDLGYSNILVELWVEACKKFIGVREKEFLLQTLTKLSTNLKIPRTNAQIIHFFHSSNFLWKFKSLFYSIEKRDFWRMLFYRCLFIEGDIDLAIKIKPYLDKNLQPLLNNLAQLKEEAVSLKDQLYSFEDSDDSNGMLEVRSLKELILHINREGLISYRMRTSENQIREGRINSEYWNDSILLEIYEDLFSLGSNKKYHFSFKELGKIIFHFLPERVKYLLSLNNDFENIKIPDIYLVSENMTIPLELACVNNQYMFQFPISYQIGRLTIDGISFEKKNRLGHSSEKKNVLIIESINSNHPTRWDEKKQAKELIFPFLGGKRELEHISTFFNALDEINSFTILSDNTASRDMILSEISQGKHDIIHIIGNIFYSKASPKDSYFLTPDDKIIKCEDISKAIKKSNNTPFLFLNTQIYNTNGKLVENNRHYFGDIFSEFEIDAIIGAMVKNYPIFNNHVRQLIEEFYLNFLKKESQGSAFKKAITKYYKEGIIDFTIGSLITSFTLFGAPWNEL